MADEIKTAELPKVEGKTFNFKQPTELMDPVTYGLYYAIRYVALTGSDPAKLPDGKIMTEAQVVEIVGPAKAKAAGLVVPPGMKEPKKTDVADKEA
jgi:hypothetical protein